MNKKVSLLQEIHRLLCEYPAGEWESLLQLIKNKNALTVLEEVSSEVHHVKSRAAKNPSKKNMLTSDKFAIADTEEGRLLNGLRNALRAKELSPTASDLRSIAECAGIKSQLPSKRNQAIDEIIRNLADKNLEEIQLIIGVATKGKSDLNAEYSKWVDHILGR